MRKYRLIAKKGEGTFSEVIKAQNIKTGTFHAIKCMKSSYKNADQVNNLREIQAIKRLTPHQNIVKLDEVLFDPPSRRLALVFELMEGNLYELMKGKPAECCDTRVRKTSTLTNPSNRPPAALRRGDRQDVHAADLHRLESHARQRRFSSRYQSESRLGTLASLVSPA